MRHNITAGRLRHYVQFTKVDVNTTDEYGKSSIRVLEFDARANVKVVSGRQLEAYNTALTEQMITVMLWYNEAVSTDMKLLWDGREYDVVNVSPSDDYRSMIVTGKFVGLVEMLRSNVAPEISGVPVTRLEYKTPYSFIPTMTDLNEEDTHVFSIVNKPSWATFSTVTGELSGTPDVPGVYADISISVSDDEFTTSLPAFDITAWRYVAQLNGVNQLIKTERIDTIDLDNPDFELEGWFDLSGTGTLWSQSTSTVSGNRELHAFTVDSTSITILLGGTPHMFALSETVKQDVALWGVKVDVTNVTLFKNGGQIGQLPTSIGAAREPTATFKVGARGAGDDDTYGFYLDSQVKNQKVWTGGDRNTGTLVLDMVVDDNSDVISNEVTVLGSELWAFGDDITLPSVSQYSVLVGSYTGLSETGTFVSEFEVDNMPAGAEMVFRLGNYTSPTISQNGLYRFTTLNVTGSTMVFQERTPGFSAGTVIRNTSIRQANGYGKFIGTTNASWVEVDGE